MNPIPRDRWQIHPTPCERINMARVHHYYSGVLLTSARYVLSPCTRAKRSNHRDPAHAFPVNYGSDRTMHLRTQCGAECRRPQGGDEPRHHLEVEGEIRNV